MPQYLELVSCGSECEYTQCSYECSEWLKWISIEWINKLLRGSQCLSGLITIKLDYKINTNFDGHGTKFWWAQNFDDQKIKPQKFIEAKVSLFVGNTSANEFSSMHNNCGSQKERANKPLDDYVIRVCYYYHYWQLLWMCLYSLHYYRYNA